MDVYDFVKSQQKGSLSICHRNLKNYHGMVFYIGFNFNIEKKQYHLNLEWMCLGLDFYGDTLVESYVYQFKSLKNLFSYLDKKYQLKIELIDINYSFDDEKFPNPIKNSDEKIIFEAAWKRFQNDFKIGKFKDTSLEMIYCSLEN